MNQFEMSATCSGHFTIEKIDSENNVIERYNKPNLITDNGLLELSKSGFVDCYVGLFTDATPVTSTKLTAPTNRLVSGNMYSYGTVTNELHPISKEFTVTHTFESLITNGTAAKNYNRIGVIKNNTLVAISTIVNDRGEEVTISLNANDRIRVIYVFKLTVPTADVVFNNVDLGKLGTTNVTIRPTNLDSPNTEFKNRGLIIQNSSMYISNGNLEEINTRLSNNDKVQNTIRTGITAITSLSPNVATTLLTTGLLYSDPMSPAAGRKDGYSLFIIPTSLFWYQIKFGKGLDYISNKVNLLFNLTFTLRRAGG